MKRYLPLLALAVAVIACQQNEVPSEVSALIEEARQAYAPDKRVALFGLQASTADGSILLQGETNLPAALAALEQKLQKAGFSYRSTVSLLPDTSLAGKVYGIVNLSVCNIRSEPRHSAELATQATLGTPLRIYKEVEGWFLVQSPDGYLGWLDPGGFSPMQAEEIRQWQAATKVAYLPEVGFARSAPDPEAPPVSDLLAGNILRMIETEGAYARVGFPDGREAYLPASEVMDYERWLASRQPDAENIIETAFTFLGRPYLWGGTSGKGVDCSGFTKSVFYLNGLLLPRDASQQVHTGREVASDTTELGSLQAGDFLFFGRKASEGQTEKITHVAIYLGDGKIIHSSGSVKVESLQREDPDFNEYRLRSFVVAKRMLDSLGRNGVLPLAEAPLYQGI